MKVHLFIKAGKHKPQCEDSAVVNADTFDTGYSIVEDVSVGIVAVADGVGGNAGGREASRFITKALAETKPEDTDSTDVYFVH